MDPSRVELRERGGQMGLFALWPIPAGQALARIAGVPVRRPSRYSIQVGLETHVEAPPVESSRWRYLNHSCDPSGRIAFHPDPLYVTARDIDAGEELTFNYLTTEWKMAEPFECRCRGEGCAGLIAGYSKLPPSARARLEPDVAPHIHELAADLTRVTGHGH